MAKVSVRTCVGCRRRSPKRELFRLVCDGDVIRWDREQSAKARGGYLHPNLTCWSKAGSVKLWERAFRRRAAERWKGSLRDALDTIRAELNEFKVVETKDGMQRKGGVRL